MDFSYKVITISNIDSLSQLFILHCMNSKRCQVKLDNDKFIEKCKIKIENNSRREIETSNINYKIRNEIKMQLKMVRI